MSTTGQKKVIIANAFSLQMVPYEDALVRIRKIKNIEEIKQLLQTTPFTSAIGHETTARVLSKLLSINISTNRVSVTLEPGVVLIVFQLLGGRLPTGQELTEQQIENEFIKTGKYEFKLVEVLNAQ
jgi:hypothetical protein